MTDTEQPMGEAWAALRAEASEWLTSLSDPPDPVISQRFMAWLAKDRWHEAAVREVSREGRLPDPGGASIAATARRWIQWLADEGPSPAFYRELRTWMQIDRRHAEAFAIALQEHPSTLPDDMSQETR